MTVAASSHVVCSASPTEINPGETVTLDASGTDATYVEFDTDGDGEYEQVDETDFIVEVIYNQTGTYQPAVRANGEPNETAACGEIVVEENNPPAAELAVDPNPATVDEPVTFDASGSFDSDGTVVEYRWDFQDDGTVDTVTEVPTAEFSYDTTGAYVPSVTVVDDDGATDRASRDLTVEEGTTAVCAVRATTVEVGEPVTLNASGSNAAYIEFDVDGDGEYEQVDETDFISNTSYAEPGTYQPVARADGNPEATDPCGEVTVTDNEPPEPEFTVDPRPGTVGQPVTFDASASSDPDGTIVEYRWDFDGDGTIDTTTTDPQTQFTYSQASGYAPTLTVEDDDGANATISGDLIVERRSRAVCEVRPTTVEVGQPVTLDASDSAAAYVEFDIDGDGEYEQGDETDFIINTSYAEPGTYQPVARVDGDSAVTDPCGEIVVEDNVPPEPEFTVTPRPGIVDESVTFDASASSDPDGSIVEYRWDFDSDGTIDETTTDPQTQFTYGQTGGYAPTLTVEDDDGANATISGDLVVRRPQSAVCQVEPTEVDPGETVTLNASGSEGIEFVEFDVDGDGEYDQGDETDFTVETSYNESGTYAPSVRAGAEGPTAPCGEIVVREPSESDRDIPIGPIGIGTGGLLGGLGLLYYFFGGAGGGGGGGGGQRTPKPKPKPGLGGDTDPRYETGVFEIPPSSGPVTVSVGFEPDLILFSATNGARTDSATDRTAGWSRGIGWSDGESVVNYSLTVADDAQTTDQATCAADDASALQIVRHTSEQPPGRVRLALAETTTDGFEVDIQVPGDDPFASGIRVHYRAIRIGSDVDLDVGTFRTPTEPGTQVVDLGVTADHVSLVGSAAVTEPGRLWTTDRGVGLTVGFASTATDEETSIDQSVCGGSAWPRAGHDSAAVCGHDVINLLYQDGDALAGRTRASVASIGSELRLRYDRVYNGPHKLGSTARHVFAYLAMNGGESMRPAVGAVPAPGPGETLQVDCGFEPAMVEITISGAPLGEEVPDWSTPQPFGWSEGTAIRDDDGLRQYVLHHAFTPSPRSGAAATGMATGAAAVDGSVSPDGGTQRTPELVPSPEIDTAEITSETVEDPAAASPESPRSADEPSRVPSPTTVPDDGIVGLSLLQDGEGTVIGRDEFHIEGMTASGFDISARRVDTDSTAEPMRRPTVVYRAWPAVEGHHEEEHASGTADDQSGGTGPPTQQGGATPGREPATKTDGASEDRSGSATGESAVPDGQNLAAGSEHMNDLKQPRETPETEDEQR
jgi:PKD repeat protein